MIIETREVAAVIFKYLNLYSLQNEPSATRCTRSNKSRAVAPVLPTYQLNILDFFNNNHGANKAATSQYQRRSVELQQHFVNDMLSFGTEFYTMRMVCKAWNSTLLNILLKHVNDAVTMAMTAGYSKVSLTNPTMAPLTWRQLLLMKRRVSVSLVQHDNNVNNNIGEHTLLLSPAQSTHLVQQQSSSHGFNTAHYQWHSFNRTVLLVGTIALLLWLLVWDITAIHQHLVLDYRYTDNNGSALMDTIVSAASNVMEYVEFFTFWILHVLFCVLLGLYVSSLFFIQHYNSSRHLKNNSSHSNSSTKSDNEEVGEEQQDTETSIDNSNSNSYSGMFKCHLALLVIEATMIPLIGELVLIFKVWIPFFRYQRLVRQRQEQYDSNNNNNNSINNTGSSSLLLKISNMSSTSLLTVRLVCFTLIKYTIYAYLVYIFTSIIESSSSSSSNTNVTNIYEYNKYRAMQSKQHFTTTSSIVELILHTMVSVLTIAIMMERTLATLVIPFCSNTWCCKRNRLMVRGHSLQTLLQYVHAMACLLSIITAQAIQYVILQQYYGLPTLMFVYTLPVLLCYSYFTMWQQHVIVTMYGW